VWCNIVRTACRRAAIRRRQLTPTFGKGEKGRFPHTAFRAAGLSKLAPRHDRSQPGKTVNRKCSETIKYSAWRNRTRHF